MQYNTTELVKYRSHIKEKVQAQISHPEELQMLPLVLDMLHQYL